MKTIQIIRVINAAFWGAALITVLVLVISQWKDSGCETSSLIIAAAFYTSETFGLGLIIDQFLREQMKKRE